MQHPEHIEMPHSIESERAVLGAVLLDNSALLTAQECLIAGDFFFPAHESIFQVMTELADENKPIDPITLGEALHQKGKLERAGGAIYMSRLAGSTPTAANISHYANDVREYAMQRQAIKAMLKQMQGVRTAADMAAGMEEAATAISSRATRGKEFHVIKDVVCDSFDLIEKRYYMRSAGGITGIASGFADLDKLTSGFQRSDLIIVAARPSMGKTALALNIAQNGSIRLGESVAVFSLEMGANQLVQRMIAAEGNVDAGRIRTGFLDDEDWSKISMSIGQLSEAKMYIDDTPTITVHEIRAKCRRLKQQVGNLGMILIDYLQLISGGGGKKENRQQEVSEISRNLKQLARELDVPVVALSQLSRAVEQRQDKRPMMSDLRESGAIEQDADIVAFLYRDDYYDKESEKKNIVEIIIAKHRNGPLGTVELAFLKNYNKFVSLDRSHHAS